MEKYRKFALETVAMVRAMADRTIPADGDNTITVDARLFGALIREAEQLSAGWNQHMEYKLSETMRRVDTTFQLETNQNVRNS
jgi:hypothetical protein